MIYKNYKRSSFIIEKRIKINNIIKRIDIILIDHNKKILIECKAPNIIINQKIFEQVARYNVFIQAKKILITNGLNHFDITFNSKIKSYTIKNCNI